MDLDLKLYSGADITNLQEGRRPSLELLQQKVALNLPVKKEKFDVKLRREIGLFSAINLIIGCMIGSGIFISPTNVLEKSGSIGLCLIIWVACGIISLLGALAYAELATLVPKSGGEYSYFLEAFKNLHPFWGELPSFLYAWTCILILCPAGMSVVCLTFAEYVSQPFSNQLPKEKKDWIKRSIAICALALMVAINLISVRLYVKLQNLFTISKLTVCVIVIIGGIHVLSTGKTQNLKTFFENSTESPKDIVLASYSGLWAYTGWGVVTVITEEIKSPEKFEEKELDKLCKSLWHRSVYFMIVLTPFLLLLKNIPRSILIAVPVVTAIYVTMNIAYMAVLTVPEMLQVPAVAVEFGNRILGPFTFIVPLGVALSSFGAALNGLFCNARLCYAAAREGHMIEILSYVHVDRLTPAPAVASQGLIMLIFILSGNINLLINFLSCLSRLFMALAMVALLLMRFTKKDHYRPYKVSIIIPIIMIMVAIFLSIVPIVINPSVEYLLAIGLLVLGFLVYVPLIYFKKVPKKFMSKVTNAIQIAFNVVPPEMEKT